ncbi:MAG: hypothetical protein ACK5YO_22965 [Planctomyces sp.]
MSHADSSFPAENHASLPGSTVQAVLLAFETLLLVVDLLSSLSAGT